MRDFQEPVKANHIVLQLYCNLCYVGPLCGVRHKEGRIEDLLDKRPFVLIGKGKFVSDRFDDVLQVLDAVQRLAQEHAPSLLFLLSENLIRVAKHQFHSLPPQHVKATIDQLIF